MFSALACFSGFNWLFKRSIFTAAALFLSQLPIVTANAAEIATFSPEGTVRTVRQVRASFTDAMVPMGQPNAAAPFDLTCKAKGSGRWIDSKNWIYDFNADLPTDTECEFKTKKDLKTLAGEGLSGQSSYKFKTGTPTISRTEPYEGDSDIAEDQYFLVHFDGELKEADLLSSLSIAVEGVESKYPVSIVPKSEVLPLFKTRLRSYSKSFGKTVFLVRTKLKFPNEAKVRLTFGTSQVLEYRVRPVFRANFTCERENANSPCNPITPMRLVFGSQIKLIDAKRVRLKTPAGKYVTDPELEKKKPQEEVYALVFKAPFEANASYVIEVPKDIKDIDGRSLENAKSFPLTVKTAGYPPLVKFASRFGVIESANPVLPVTVRAVEAQLPTSALDLKTLKVANTEQEFVKWASKIQSKDWSSDTNSSIFTDFTAKGVEKKTLPKPNGKDAFEVMGVPLKGPGFHIVEIESKILGTSLIGTRPMFVSSAALVTNLAVHMKYSSGRSLIWVTRLSDGEPVANAQVGVYTCKNEKISSGTTNKDGLFFFDKVKEGWDPCPTDVSYKLLATASLGADRSFVVDTWNSGIESYRFNVPYSYSDQLDNSRFQPILSRSLLRAGETLNVKHIARMTTENGFRMPKGDEFPGAVGIQHMGTDELFTFKVQFDAKGVATTDWKIPKAAKLGTYRIVYLKDEKAKPDWETTTAETFRVEEFKIPVLKATVQPEQGPLVMPEAVQTNFSLQYLSGGPAANQNIVVRTQFTPNPGAWFPDYEDYVFAQPKLVEGIRRSTDDDDEESGSGASSSESRGKVSSLPLTLDKAGSVSTRLKIPVRKLDRSGILSIEMEYRDPNGNVETASANAQVYSTDRHVGLLPKAWSTTVDKVSMTAVVVDLKGKPQAGVRVRIDQYLRDYYSTRKRLVGGFYGYESANEIKKLGSFCEGTTDAKGLFTCEKPASRDGEILFQAVIQDSKGREATTSRSVYVYAKDRMWFDMSDDDRMDVLSEAKEYQSGQTAKYQVRMPFKKAKALVTVEREGILDAYVTDLGGEKPEVTFQVKPNYSPNAYVSVLAVRGRADEFKPTALVDLGKPSFKLGLGKMRVGWAPHELKVRPSTDKPVYQTRDKAKVSISVSPALGGKLPAETEIAVIVVDEALLELAKNNSVNLLAAMMKERNYDVKTSTLQTNVVGKRHFGKKALPAGGGGGRGTTRELFDTLILWKARVPVSSSGVATVDVPLNDSISKFRVTAIAFSDTEMYGTGESTFTTTRDLQVIAGLPLVVREGDDFKLEATLRNSTAQKMDVAANLSVGTTKLATQAVAIAAGASQVVSWPVVIPQKVESLKFVLSAEAAGSRIQDAVSKTIPVLEAVPVTTLQATLERATPQYKTPVQYPAEALPGKGEVRVNLKAKLGDSLESVKEAMADYPWSCFEQQLSKAIVADNKKAWADLSASMPSYLDGNGLLKYWPTMTDGSDVLTAYVLSVTKEAGWALPKDSETKMVEGLSNFVLGKLNRTESDLETRYLHLRKMTAIEALSRYKSDVSDLVSTIQVSPQTWPTSAVLDWWATLNRTKGLPARAQKLTEANRILKARLDFRGTRLGFSNEKDDFYSYLMSSPDLNAARLMLGASRLPDWKAEMPRLVRGVMDRRKLGVWYNTTANAWNVLAMKRFSQDFEKDAVAGVTTAKMGGQTKAFEWKAAKAGGGFVDLARPVVREELVVSHQGSGQPWVTTEIRASIPLKAPTSNGFKIKREISPVQQKVSGKWSRGDVARVKLSFDSQTDSTWIVVQDPIPAGSSILGTGLGSSGSSLATQGEKSDGSSWMTFNEKAADSYRAYFQYVDKGSSSIEYTVRLNQSGRFQLPPTKIQAMYAPDLLGEAPNAVFEVLD